MWWLLALLTLATAPPAPFAGVEVNQDADAVDGWTLCHADTYAPGTDFYLTDLQALCPASNYIFLCRPLTFNQDQDIEVAGLIPNADWPFTDEALTTVGAAPDDLTAYRFSNLSFGISDEAVGEPDLAPCDGIMFAGSRRMCWQTGPSQLLVAGGRCGFTFLSGGSQAAQWTREIYSDPCRGVADGVLCDDRSLCTVNDTCVDEVCVGTSIVPNVTQCIEEIQCNPFTGNLTYVPVNAGTPCDDGDTCTFDEVCLAGVCTNGISVSCPLPGPASCRGLGTCVSTPGNYTCDYPLLANGTNCNDGLYCTVVDQCVDGECLGVNRTCTATTECRTGGFCDEVLDTCVYNELPDFTPCNQTNLCSNVSFCLDGLCDPQEGTVCPPTTTCTPAYSCSLFTGFCSPQTAPDNTACDDGQPATVGDRCVGGACIGTLLTCPPPGQCFDEGINVNGTCVPVFLPPGTPCSTGAPCTEGETCDGAGGCGGGSPRTCSPLTPCDAAGPCDPLEGCVFTPLPAGTPCNTFDVCQTDETCTADGNCVGTLDTSNPSCLVATGAPSAAARLAPWC